MEKEILNLEYHSLRILVKVLSQCHSFKEAAEITGVAPSTLYRMLWRGGIEYKKSPKGRIEIVKVPTFVFEDTEGKKELEIPIT